MSAPFDPNAPASADAGLFGLTYELDEAELVVVPVGWEATTSYGGGAARAPEAILRASHQVDLYDLDVRDPWRVPLALAPAAPDMAEWNRRGKDAAQVVIGAATGERPVSEADMQAALREVNQLGAQVDEWVRAECTRWLERGKLVAVLGGDHSVPLGAFEAIAAKHPELGILHVDAHADLRDAYEGFERSHASIMRNACERIPQLVKLVQVGLRDVCEEEIAYIEQQKGRIVPFFDRDLARRAFAGDSWQRVVADIVEALPRSVWISFDIDGLDPVLCPSTGTPVPGGLGFQQTVYLLRAVVESGRTILGFDLNEVSPAEDEHDEWDANVGARMLYKLIGLMLASQGKATLQA